MNYKSNIKAAGRQRNCHGSMLVLVIVSLTIVIVVATLVTVYVGRLIVNQEQQHSAVEAAALVAASDLSKIVVKDPYFGYIGLSNCPPVGTDRLAGDGEPLPVLSINNIIANARMQHLVAEALDNPELRLLARQDLEHSNQASQNLVKRWRLSLSPTCPQPALDGQGHQVKPYDDAKRVYLGSIKIQALKQFQLSLGWLKHGGTTCVPAPLPSALAQLPAQSTRNGCYRAFVDIPVKGAHFSFAAAGKAPAICDVRDFQLEDANHICSIVKVEAVSTIKDANANATALKTTACAQPYSLPDTMTSGVLMLSFPNGLVPDLKCLCDCLNNRSLQSTRAHLMMAQGGDYPNDANAMLVPTLTSTGENSPTLAQLITHGLHDWVATAHAPINLDDLVAIFNQPLAELAKGGPGDPLSPLFTCQFAGDGKIVVINQSQSPFAQEEVLEGQSYAVEYGCPLGSRSWTVVFKDYAGTIDIDHAGKHGGQMPSGNPVNWCELPGFGNSSALAQGRGQGPALGLSVSGRHDDCAGGDAAVNVQTAYFHKWDGGDLSQPRKSWYSGGLAASIELSAPRRLARLN